MARQKSDPRFFGDRYINPKRLEGKTVKKVDIKFGDNCLKITFEDGDIWVVDTASIGNGFITPVVNDISDYGE